MEGSKTKTQQNQLQVFMLSTAEWENNLLYKYLTVEEQVQMNERMFS